MDKKFEMLNDMAKTIYQNNKEKGFWDKERNMGETLMLVVTELAEAMEAYRKGQLAPVPVPFVDNEVFKAHYKDTFEDEIADSIIRLLDLCGGFHIDIAFHVREKVQYNMSRERLHGKKF
jgi:NTP pyrophosphatase (non-canonical NTP hydrolase)